MTRDELATGIMAAHGYVAQSTHPGEDLMGFQRETLGVRLVAYVYPKRTNVEIRYSHGGKSLTVTSGLFALTHPEFKKLETNVVYAALALSLYGL